MKKENLSVRDFAKYIRDKDTRFSEFLFCSENQEHDECFSPIVYNFIFNKISVMPGMGAVYFRFHNSTVGIYGIKSISIDESSSPLGTIVQIICEQKLPVPKEITYIVIAR